MNKQSYEPAHESRGHKLEAGLTYKIILLTWCYYLLVFSFLFFRKYELVDNFYKLWDFI